MHPYYTHRRRIVTTTSTRRITSVALPAAFDGYLRHVDPKSRSEAIRRIIRRDATLASLIRSGADDATLAAALRAAHTNPEA